MAGMEIIGNVLLAAPFLLLARVRRHTKYQRAAQDLNKPSPKKGHNTNISRVERDISRAHIWTLVVEN